MLIQNLGEWATAVGSEPRAGVGQGRIERRRDVEILCADGRIVFVGPRAERRQRFGEVSDHRRYDAEGAVAVPGFVDPHTHLPWAGSREEEFARRLAGASYGEIADAGGGILSTVEATRAASEEELTAAVRSRLDRMLRWGTTTAEAKSGYGLSVEEELKQLRAVEAAARHHPIDVVPTLLAAHEVPPEHREDRNGYLDLVCEEIVPWAAETGLARFNDVFCEQGVFSVAESRRVLEAGAEHGLVPRLHADEFVDSGGAELAAEVGAASADHLTAVGERGITALAGSDVVAILLPGTSFFLMKGDYAPARRLVEAGIPVALATDCNPGSSHTESMVTIFVLAVYELGLSIEEALVAMTLNAACSLGLGGEIGTLEAGKRADIVLLDLPNLLHLAYHYGIDPVKAVFKNGELVYSAPGFGSS